MRQMAFQANVGIAMTEGYINKHHTVHAREAILRVAKYDHEMLIKMMRAADPDLPEDYVGPPPAEPWINFASVEATETRKKKGAKKQAAPETVCLPKVIEHCEGACGKAGIGQQVQDSQPAHTTPTKKWIQIPWRVWLTSDIGRGLDAEAADTAAAIMALRGLHRSDDFLHLPIEVQTKDDGSGKRAIAVADTEAGMLALPPCVPKAAKLSKDSQSHLRQAIVVTRMYTTPPIATTYYVTPEWKMPKDTTEVDPDAGASLPDDMISWEFAGDETLHPFWAVLRLSPQELAKKWERANAVSSIWSWRSRASRWWWLGGCRRMSRAFARKSRSP